VKKHKRFVGLDVHSETISVAVAERDGEVRSIGKIPNRPETIRKLVRKLGRTDEIRACYEAGPCAYVLYWQLTELGIECDVVAPSLVPVKAGDRVKTDRRDAEKLARCPRAGDLTKVWVPTPDHEALRDLVRAREAAKRDQVRARHGLSKFLLRHGQRPTTKMKAGSARHMEWIRRMQFENSALEATRIDYFSELEHCTERIIRLEHAIDAAIETIPEEIKAVIAGLQALRGIAKINAVTIVTEIGCFSRFQRAKQIMGYNGLVSSEYSSGGKTWRGAITKSGNAHLRRVLVEAAWCCRHRPCRSYALKKRQESLPANVCEIATKAQHRLHSKYVRLLAKGKAPSVAVAAIARELLGFIWAIGTSIEREKFLAEPRRQAA
jgi:transposase